MAEHGRPNEDSLDLVYDVLKATSFLLHFFHFLTLEFSFFQEVEFKEYFPKIRDDLNLTRLSHFEHVKVQDLTQIGLGRPAGRRLLSAVRQRRARLEPNLLHGFLDLVGAFTDCLTRNLVLYRLGGSVFVS